MMSTFKKLFLTPKGNVRSSFNNLPPEIYPNIAKFMNGKQLAQFATASPNFFRWIILQPKLLGKISVARRNYLLATKRMPGNYPGHPRGPQGYPTPSNYKFLTNKGNYARMRAAAYARMTGRKLTGRHEPRFNTNLLALYDPFHNIEQRHLAGIRPAHEVFQYVGNPLPKNLYHMRHYIKGPNYKTNYHIEYGPTRRNINIKTGLPTRGALAVEKKLVNMVNANSNFNRNNNNSVEMKRYRQLVARYHSPQLLASLARARTRLASKNNK
jgi:hypothetical protein